MWRRLGVHAAALAVVLLALLALTGTDSVVSADEGAMLAELDLLDRTGSWTLPNPEPEVDPGQRWLPLELSERSVDERWAPFAKHPGHVVALRPLWAAGGLGGVLVLSVAGVVVASVAAARIAERIRPGTGVAALWLTGVGSPLLFDGFQVVGHALGAGLFGAAVVLALRAVTKRASGRVALAGWSVGVALAVAATGLVRSEGVLAGFALAAGFGVAGALGRRREALAVAVASAVGASAVWAGEPLLLERALGAASAGVDPQAGTDAGSFLSGRWSGFRITVLDPGYGVDGGESFLLLALVLAAGAALAWRLRRDPVLVQALLVAAAACGVVRMATASFLVPGLLPALPLLAIGLVLARADAVRAWPAVALWASAATFVVAVVLTQYRTGGTGEWGGRYYAVALPLLVALATVTAARAAEDLPVPARRVAFAAVAVLTATIAVGAVRATDRARDSAARTAAAVVAHVDGLDVDATVSARGAVSRFAWEHVLDGRRWLTAEGVELGDVLDALADDGARRLALITAEPERDTARAAAAGWTGASRADVRTGTAVVLLER